MILRQSEGFLGSCCFPLAREHGKIQGKPWQRSPGRGSALPAESTGQRRESCRGELQEKGAMETFPSTPSLSEGTLSSHSKIPDKKHPGGVPCQPPASLSTTPCQNSCHIHSVLPSKPSLLLGHRVTSPQKTSSATPVLSQIVTSKPLPAPAAGKGWDARGCSGIAQKSRTRRAGHPAGGQGGDTDGDTLSPHPELPSEGRWQSRDGECAAGWAVLVGNGGAAASRV